MIWKFIKTTICVSILSFVLLEILLRISGRKIYGIQRLTTYKYDIPRYDLIRELETLVRSAPVPLEPCTYYQGFVLNSKGFRTPEYELEKRCDSKRIVFIGDSFTFSSAILYPDHFTNILKERLKNSLRKNVEIINLGLPSIGPRFEKRILELEGIHLNPDLLIWAFFVGNDFTDEMPLAVEGDATLSEFFLMNCFVARLVRNGTILFSYAAKNESRHVHTKFDSNCGKYLGTPQDYDPDAQTFSKSDFLGIQAYRMSIYSETSFPSHHWESLKKILLDVRHICEKARIPLLFVIIPDENQIDLKLLEEVAKRYGKKPDYYQMDYPQQLLSEFFDANSIDYLDLLPSFRDKGAHSKLYRNQDTHWNEAGNLLAGVDLFKFLKENPRLLNRNTND